MVDVASTLPDLHAVSAHPATATTQLITRERQAPGRTRAFAAAPPPAARQDDPPPVARRGDVPPVAPRPPDGPAAPPPEERRRRRSWIPVAAALIVVALGVVLAVVLLGSNHNNGGNAANGPATQTHSTAASRPPARPTSAKPTTTTPRPSPRPSAPSHSKHVPKPKPNGAPTDRQLADAVVRYFSLIPGNLDAGWNMLTPHFQNSRAQNRQTYDSYWGSVQRVDVSNASGQAPNRASATLTYHFKDGRVVTEQTSFRFARHDGTLEIDDES
jgi:hypothetical protein